MNSPEEYIILKDLYINLFPYDEEIKPVCLKYLIVMFVSQLNQYIHLCPLDIINH
jgi:hypothetical protein